MPNAERTNCQVCGGHYTDVGPITWAGNCVRCADALSKENVLGLASKQGPAYRRWKRGMIAYAESLRLDEPRSRT